MRIRVPMLAALMIALSLISARAETVVRYGISMADIPLTTGQPDRGAGAYQFTAYTIYDPLVAWDMDVADRPGKLVPGLATEWKVDDADKTKWRFTLRKGVKFHDGSDFNADAVIWNLDKVLNDKAPQFDKRQSAQVKTRLPSVASPGIITLGLSADERSHIVSASYIVRPVKRLPSKPWSGWPSVRGISAAVMPMRSTVSAPAMVGISNAIASSAAVVVLDFSKRIPTTLLIFT